MKSTFSLVFLLLSIMFLWASCTKESTPIITSGPAHLMLKVLGDNQGDIVNRELAIPLKIKIEDSLGVGVAREMVTFSVIKGGGLVNSSSVTTDGNGFGEVMWTLGDTIGLQEVSVSANIPNGSPLNFTAMGISCVSTFTDLRDGNIYCEVTIGTQTWMAENLRYNALGSWLHPLNPSPTYGRLYDWATVMNGGSSSNAIPSGIQGICPNGWHLPSDAEWGVMEIALGLDSSSAATDGNRGTHGIDMKSIGWNLNGNGTNIAAFNGLAGGLYDPTSGGFINHGYKTHFWTSTEGTSSNLNAWFRSLCSYQNGVSRGTNYKKMGSSCRCIKD